MSGPRTTPTVTKQEAAQMGLLTPDEQHTPAATQLASRH
jgi:hypothetical protein